MNKKNIVVLLIFTYNMCFSQDLVSEGSNRWILHTPDDGRTTMWVAPYTNNDWQWSLATQFLNNGNVLFNGNVGIGTTSPNSKLTIRSGSSGVSINPGVNPYFGTLAFNRESGTGEIFDANGQAFQINNGGSDKNLHFQVYNGNGSQITDNALVISGTNGNVGIGTATPSAKLDVNGVIQTFNKDSNLATWDNVRIWAEGESSFIESNGDENGLTIRSNTGNKILLMNNVGIGTTAPDEKLTVKGKIHAQEVRVDLQGACAPDYVFQKYYTGKSTLKSDYVMPTLAEIESFTKKNHHLPNVPSAQEVQQNGVSLGTMSNVLLQKVEELTLYAIEQNKELERLKTENNMQSKEIKTLKKENEIFINLSKRLAEIENQLK